MRSLIIFLVLVVIVVSCSGPKLYQQGLNKIEKAIEKDSTLSFPTDTISVINYDTIPGVNGSDSIILIKETIEIPCTFDVEAFKQLVKNKSRRELRFERKSSRDSIKHLEKMYKLETNRLEDSLHQMNKHYKQEVKVLKSDNATEVKLSKQETKQKKGSWFTRLLGRFWWIVFIVGGILGMYIGRFIPSFK